MAKKIRGRPTRQHEVIPQNASPVTRLSPEILSEIFLYHARPTPGGLYQRNGEHDIHWFCGHGHTRWHDEYEGQKNRTTWLRILRVCRQWRHVALGCALLWTNIDTAIRSLRLFMLQQSKESLITLRTIRIQNDKSEGNKKLVFENLPRLRCLALHFHQCSDDDMTRTISQLLSPGFASHLVSLELAIDISSANYQSLFVPHPPPSLASLTLTNLMLTFPPDSTTLSHITHLSLKFVPLEDWFYDTLDRLPHLLRLDIANPSEDDEPPPTSRTIPASLTELQQFSFHGFPSSYLSVMLLLSLPPTTYHCLTFPDYCGPDTIESIEETSLYGTISAILRKRTASDNNAFNYRVKFSVTTNTEEGGGGFNPSDPEARSTRTMILATPRPSLSCNDATITAAECTTVDPIPVLTVEQQSRNWEWAYGTSKFAEGLSNLTESLPVDAVEELHIRSNMPLTIDHAVNDESDAESSATEVPHFLTFPNLRTLHLEGLGPLECVPDLLSLTRTVAMDVEPGQGSDDAESMRSQTFTAFPNLEKLVLSKVDWTKESEIYTFSAEERVPPVLDSVASALKVRAQKYNGKHKLKHLVVIGGGIPKGWVKTVREEKWLSAVGGVDWVAQERCEWDYDWDDDEEGEDGRGRGEDKDEQKNG
ncbi:uncharacterized protein STEHIDRAFT_138034 [Stereum hirsutum FP-91666 SS1]|uniref:uncharacterized protein n=1 Tax=Stereum hirsutum (strain FP-91666) TaxID=721885 RepID=UPI000440F217|nr:uncharacterized protein STEHIDRAFT_138034 [Stereum hirsutum FP-91666 SS1]EIM88861.1 hypothetical protein STEHIDRAFT_138034 [Stereum hirsutum FP-91666 SS1]